MAWGIHDFSREILGTPIVRDVFIETGTNQGATLFRAKDHFKECHSIEAIPRWYKHCQEIFNEFPHVNLYLGRSPEVLPEIMNKSKATTFWLDAHYFEIVKDHELKDKLNSVECPLLDELHAIVAVDWEIKPLIMIDDCVMFQPAFWESNKPCFHKDKWPTEEQIKDILKDYEMLEDDGIFYFA
jgi:hypothetical protein